MEVNMNAQQLESEALHLPLAERAHLAQKLILSLDALTDDEIEETWLIEAKRRAQEIDNGEVTPIPASETMKKVKALLR